jgi:hypothetical protein
MAPVSRTIRRRKESSSKGLDGTSYHRTGEEERWVALHKGNHDFGHLYIDSIAEFLQPFPEDIQTLSFQVIRVSSNRALAKRITSPSIMSTQPPNPSAPGSLSRTASWETLQPSTFCGSLQDLTSVPPVHNALTEDQMRMSVLETDIQSIGTEIDEIDDKLQTMQLVAPVKTSKRERLKHLFLKTPRTPEEEEERKLGKKREELVEKQMGMEGEHSLLLAKKIQEDCGEELRKKRNAAAEERAQKS